jgi:hypothetical protein
VQLLILPALLEILDDHLDRLLTWLYKIKRVHIIEYFALEFQSLDKGYTKGYNLSYFEEVR